MNIFLMYVCFLFFFINMFLIYVCMVFFINILLIYIIFSLIPYACMYVCLNLPRHVLNALLGSSRDWFNSSAARFGLMK